MNHNDNHGAQAQDLFIEELGRVTGGASESTSWLAEALRNVKPGSIPLTSRGYGEEGAPFPAGFTPTTTHPVSGLETALASFLAGLQKRS